MLTMIATTRVWTITSFLRKNKVKEAKEKMVNDDASNGSKGGIRRGVIVE